MWDWKSVLLRLYENVIFLAKIEWFLPIHTHFFCNAHKPDFPSPSGVLPMVNKKPSSRGGKGAAAKGSRATRSKVDDGSVEAPASFDTGWKHLKVSPVYAAVTIRFTS